MRKSHLRLTATVFGAYSIAVSLIAFWPVPVDRSMGGTLGKMLSWLHSHGMPGLINYQFVEFSANIIFFAPMGAIMGLWIKRRISTIIISTYISIAIEAIQELFLPQRYSTVFDVLANTLGAALGVIVFCPLVVRFLANYDAFVAAEEAENDEPGEWLSERWPDQDES